VNIQLRVYGYAIVYYLNLTPELVAFLVAIGVCAFISELLLVD
jgi:hypothetical protein